MVLHYLRRRSHSSAQGHREGAGPQASLLPAAVYDRLDPIVEFPSNIQSPDSLRPVHLVPRETDEVCRLCECTKIHCARGLGGIAVKQGPIAVKHRSDAGKVLDSADFVIDCHD